MESSDDRTLRLDRYLRALAALEEVLQDTPSVPASILRDSRIQRFEFTFETLWKFLRVAAEHAGVDADTPRGALRAALQIGLLDPTDEADAWQLIRYRNLTVHTYDEALSCEVECFIVNTAIHLFRKIAARGSSGA
jgi:nucleotidyltransferase substrate binding protein (TIGR01987 family)